MIPATSYSFPTLEFTHVFECFPDKKDPTHHEASRPFILVTKFYLKFSALRTYVHNKMAFVRSQVSRLCGATGRDSVAASEAGWGS